MMRLSISLTELLPDVAQTVNRFAFATLLIALATLVALVGINELFALEDELTARLFAGLATGAVLAVAGNLFAESRSDRPMLALGLIYAVPLIAIALFQVRTTTWIVAPALPAIALLWLPVAAYTQISLPEGRRAQEDRFWWLNHRAVTSAAIAAIALAVLVLGLVAIERSLSLLFGLESNDLIYKWVLPVICFFCAPIYWLSTVPRLQAFAPNELSEPDFVSRAIGFLGQFILTPLLMAYALILLAYTAQIAFTQSLPQGTLGWMVMAFVIAGAANWLILHPAFMRDRLVVRLFRRGWFWATLLPIALFAIGVWVRIDAYGFTPERLLLLTGGLWAALLAMCFLLPRLADIRLIPLLAGALLLAVSVGPWNFVNLANLDQMSRLRAAIAEAQSEGGEFEWNSDARERANGALNYLLYAGEAEGDVMALLDELGVERPTGRDIRSVADAISLPLGSPGEENRFQNFRRDENDSAISVADTPFSLGPVDLARESEFSFKRGLYFRLSETQLLVRTEKDVGPEQVLEVLPVLPLDQNTETFDSAVLHFTLAGKDYALVLENAYLNRDASSDTWEVNYLSGGLYASAP